jgi:hypothetical protein
MKPHRYLFLVHKPTLFQLLKKIGKTGQQYVSPIRPAEQGEFFEFG